jgi:membrane protease YdiL (CAAX protease family)
VVRSSLWVYERTRSLWPSILLHAAFNSFVVFSVNIDVGGSPATWLGLSFMGCIAGGLWLVRMLESNDMNPTDELRRP